MLPPQRARRGLVLSVFGLVLGLCPLLQAGAQTLGPVGGETTPLGALNGEQVWPSLSLDSSGGWLVWEDNTIEGSGKGRGIAAARLGSDLAVVGAPIQANSSAAGNQEKPQVVRLAGGAALVAWETTAPGNSVGTPAANAGVYARILPSTGAPSGADVRVSPVSAVMNQKRTVQWSGIFRNKAKTRTYKFNEKISQVREHAGGVSLVALPDGGAVVLYHGVRRTYTNTWALSRETKFNGNRSTTNDVLQPVRLTGDWMQDIYMQRLDAAGQKVGAEVQVNQYDRFNQRNPSAALLANGNLLVTWVSEKAVSSSATANLSVGLVGRELSVSGEPVGDEFTVAEDATRAVANPTVLAVGNGFGIYWSQHEATFSRNWNVYGRVFQAAGNPTSPSTLINDHTAGDQFAPRVATSGAVQFVVWTSLGQDGSREGVYGRALSSGLPVGGELALNTTTPSRQHQPSVAGAGDGRFLTVWSGYAGASSFDLYSQVFETNAAAR